MQKSAPFQVYNASAGSGKTFTLVKEYLKILLTTDDIFRFQNILAITFTNKAAAEMKERVLHNLKEFSEEKINDMFETISNETAISAKVLQQRSSRVLNSILQNYSAFNITTIDAFTYRIIRNFSFDLGLSLNFEIEMDATLLLEEAVDLLISKIGLDKELTKVLVDYSLAKTDDDKSWDISRDLQDFAKILLNENDAKQLKKIASKTVEDFINLKNYIQKTNKVIENKFVEIGENGLETIRSMNLEYNDFYRSMLPNHFKNLVSDFNKAKFFDQSKLRERIEENTFYSKSKSDDVKTAIESILPELLKLYTASEQLFERYTLNSLVLKSLIPLAVLKHINTSLNEIKEQNNIRLNAEFNQIISDKIKDEPAPFIYERIGEKFRYYFIDEMQDTSQLQWQNLIPLIENALTSETEKGERGNLMLVGDAKQAIYRWRGGKAEQFIDLTLDDNPFSINKSEENLDTNFRSYSEIIDFNNQFFTHIADFLHKEDYKALYINGNQQKTTKKEGGFVQISFVEKDKNDDEKELVFAKKTLSIIQNLECQFDLKDICVLVRKKKEGVVIANYLSENKIPIISSETLLLKNNKTVNFIIDLLSFLNNSQTKEGLVKALYYLKTSKNLAVDTHSFLNEFVDKSSQEVFATLRDYGFLFNPNEFVSLPFYDGIEYILRCFDLTTDADAYLFSFLDAVLLYQQRNDGELTHFLAYWEQKKDHLCIVTPTGQDAVQIMTIHKSKGLEFPVVIYPYDLDIYKEIKPTVWYDKLDKEQFLNFETSLVQSYKKLSYTGVYGAQLFADKREETQLDNLNLLYVALTRAVEQLYIISEKKNKTNDLSTARFYSDFFVDFLKVKGKWNKEETSFDFGNSQRISLKKKISSEVNFKKQEQFISSAWKNHNISIVANASKLWDTKQQRAINHGNLIHEIMSKIKTQNDVDSVLNQYVFDGVITHKEAVNIQKTIINIVTHPLLTRYFTSDIEVFNERELISINKLRQIPDRVVIKDEKAIIIDYKTGVQKDIYKNQLLSYKTTLNEIGYKVEEMLLIYIDSKVIVKKLK